MTLEQILQLIRLCFPPILTSSRYQTKIYDNADIEQIPINDSPVRESTEKKQTELGMMTRMVYLV